METELKLRFDQQDGQKAFLESSWVHNLVMPDSRVETMMLSRYYDTVDHVLTGMNTSLRMRLEGENKVVTIKLGSKSSNGLHQRLEWSVDLADEDWIGDPDESMDISWFQKYAVSDGDPDDRLREILAKIEGRPLVEICQAKFLRTAFDVGFGDTLMELALDSGEIKAGELTDTINELELELKEGDVRDLMDLGQELMARFELTPEPKSKYARCLALLQQARHVG